MRVIDPVDFAERTFLERFACYVFLRTLLSPDVREVITNIGIVGVPLKGWGKNEIEISTNPRVCSTGRRVRRRSVAGREFRGYTYRQGQHVYYELLDDEVPQGHRGEG